MCNSAIRGVVYKMLCIGNMELPIFSDWIIAESSYVFGKIQFRHLKTGILAVIDGRVLALGQAKVDSCKLKVMGGSVVVGCHHITESVR